DSRIWWV
nr:Chain B, Peptide H1-C1 [synthetic construct]